MGIARFIKRLSSSQDELANQDLQREAQQEGAQAIGQCQDRQVVHLRGILSEVVVIPRSSTSRWLEAVLDDGSGKVHLVWMGRRTIKGIDAGRRLRVQGRLSYVDGRRTIYNPRYELLP